MRKHKRTNESYSVELLLSSISKKAAPSPPPTPSAHFFFYGHAIMFSARALSLSPLCRKEIEWQEKRKHYKTRSANAVRGKY
jgi:hypothetical protein